jgi:hypothetical protein
MEGSDGWRRLRSATLCRAWLRYGGERVSEGGERTTGRHRQIDWRMAFCLRRKISVGTNDLSPKEATEMSHEVKYIGYVELDIADTMWPSGLCRGGVQTGPRRLGRVAISRNRSTHYST